jgi:hypothetical protein
LGKLSKGEEDEWSLSPALVDLELSHNYISGEIPIQIQQRQSWSVLDLSFNELTGTLVSDMALHSNASLYLSVNRLSGSIPEGLLDMGRISILQGNYFGVPLSLGTLGLPENDPYVSRYQGGSKSLLLLITGGV